MAPRKKVADPPVSTPRPTKNTRSTKSVVPKAASNATPVVTPRQAVGTPASSRLSSTSLSARPTRKRNADENPGAAPSSQRRRTREPDPFGIEDEYDSDGNPTTPTPGNPNVLESLRRRKGTRARQVTPVQEEPATEPLSSPDNEEARLAAQLAEHKRKKAEKKEAERKEAERKRLEEEEAARQAEPDSELETDKPVRGQGGGRVQTQNRVAVPASAVRDPYTEQEKMCLRCVKEMGHFPELVCHRFDPAFPVCADCAHKSKPCELVSCFFGFPRSGGRAC